MATVVTPTEAAWADEPVLHRVTYTVTADQPTDVGVYYRDVDPPSWADYSHNPYLYSPKAEVPLGPGTPWVLDVMLADPDRWAMVAVSQNRPQEERTLHCQLTVDGIVVDTADGSHGALCSLRSW
nr:hypothetical protein [Mycolicibacterium komossense]